MDLSTGFKAKGDETNLSLVVAPGVDQLLTCSDSIQPVAAF
jgi:hypothetical protein